MSKYESDSDDFGDDDDDYDYEYEYEDDDADGDCEMKAAPARRDVDKFTVHDMAAMSGRQAELAAQVAEVLGLSPTQCSSILRHFKWNKLTVENRWFEDEDKVECSTCMCDVSAADMKALNCGHAFCCDCWTEYLTHAIDDGPSCVITRCMESECGECVPDLDVVALVDERHAKRYRDYVLRSFVEQNRAFRWCPRPGCDFAIEYPPGGMRDIDCKCGHAFCFACGEEPHRPSSCETVERWQIKNTAESENVTWIMANTKKCPKCRTPIEKNQGCNHMTCRKAASGCGYEFCWLCMGPWAEHGTATGGYYKCNKWEKDNKAGKRTAEDAKRQEAKSSLDKYIHYFNRFINHDRARKIAVRSLPDIQSHMEDLQGICSYKLSDVTFIRDAADQVIRCRQVLKWTYVYAYYLENDVERNFFEHLQEMLEKNTEHLHGLVETPLDQYLDPARTPKVPFFDHRSNVTNYTGVTKKFLENLLVGVETGLTESAMMAGQ